MRASSECFPAQATDKSSRIIFTDVLFWQVDKLDPASLQRRRYHKSILKSNNQKSSDDKFWRCLVQPVYGSISYLANITAALRMISTCRDGSGSDRFVFSLPSGVLLDKDPCRRFGARKGCLDVCRYNRFYFDLKVFACELQKQQWCTWNGDDDKLSEQQN